MGLVISGSLVKFIQQLIDEDGSVKDSAVGYWSPYEEISVVAIYTYMSICQMKRPYSLYVKIMILSETIFFSVPSFLFSVLISERQHVIDVASLTTRNLSFFLDCGIISLVSFLIYLFYFLILGFAFKSFALKRSREQVRLLERKVICRFF